MTHTAIERLQLRNVDNTDPGFQGGVADARILDIYRPSTRPGASNEAGQAQSSIVLGYQYRQRRVQRTDCLHLRLENIDIDVWCREDDATKACNDAIAARNTELAQCFRGHHAAHTVRHNHNLANL